jgi:transcriptional regulator with XRE-family HTH domain
VVSALSTGDGFSGRRPRRRGRLHGMNDWRRRASDCGGFQDPLFEDLALLLRSARHIGGRSQRELAAAAGVDPAIVARIESHATLWPSFPLVLSLLKAAECRLQAVDASGEPLQPRPYEAALDAGFRHWPAHLEVKPVRTDGDWWYGLARPANMPLPAYTADWERLKGRPQAPRRRKAERTADSEARNTPPGPQVTETDLTGG